MPVTFFAWKLCSVRLYTWLFVGGWMSYLRYLCLIAHSGVQHILCCVFVLFFFVLYTLGCQFLWIVFLFISSSVFSNVYLVGKLLNWSEEIFKFIVPPNTKNVKTHNRTTQTNWNDEQHETHSQRVSNSCFLKDTRRVIHIHLV